MAFPLRTFSRSAFWAGNSMMETAENVAKEIGITKEECDEVVLRRFEQFMEAIADDRAFQ